MVRLNTLKNIIRANSHYIPVLAASLIFGSWALTNLLLDRIGNYKDTLSKINQATEASERQDDLVLRLGNIHKLVLRNRDKTLPSDIKNADPTVTNMYWNTLEEEVTQSFYDDWLQLYKDVSNLSALTKSMNAPDTIIEKSRHIKSWCDSLYYLFVKAGREKDSLINLVLQGGSLSLYKTTPEQANKISSAISAYNRNAHHGALVKDYIPITNSKYRILADLKFWAQKKIDSLEFWSDIFKWLSIFLYTIGTILAIYSKWLEQHSKEED